MLIAVRATAAARRGPTCHRRLLGVRCTRPRNGRLDVGTQVIAETSGSGAVQAFPWLLYGLAQAQAALPASAASSCALGLRRGRPRLYGAPACYRYSGFGGVSVNTATERSDSSRRPSARRHRRLARPLVAQRARARARALHDGHLLGDAAEGGSHTLTSLVSPGQAWSEGTRASSGVAARLRRVLEPQRAPRATSTSTPPSRTTSTGRAPTLRARITAGRRGLRRHDDVAPLVGVRSDPSPSPLGTRRRSPCSGSGTASPRRTCARPPATGNAPPGPPISSTGSTPIECLGTSAAEIDAVTGHFGFPYDHQAELPLSREPGPTLLRARRGARGLTVEEHDPTRARALPLHAPIGYFAAFVRFMRDPNGSTLGKLFLAAAVAYVVMPIDFIPESSRSSAGSTTSASPASPSRTP